MSKPKKTITKWQIKNRRKAWPLCICREDDISPVWVWGDLKLAEKIVGIMNKV